MTRTPTILFSLFCVVGITFSAHAQDKYMQIQMLQRKIETLTAERARQYEELVECEKQTNKYTIAGISAISAANLGLSLNAKLQARLNKLSNVKSGGGNLFVDDRPVSEKCKDDYELMCTDPPDTSEFCQKLKRGECV